MVHLNFMQKCGKRVRLDSSSSDEYTNSKGSESDSTLMISKNKKQPAKSGAGRPRTSKASKAVYANEKISDDSESEVK